MNRAKVAGILSVIFFSATEQAHGQANPFEQDKIIPEKFTALPIAAVKPLGWLKEQLRENLNGFTGHLDQLAPDLILNDDIYGAQRLTSHIKNKNVGALSDSPAAQVQFLWWNSETQSNWWDGYVRTSILLDDKANIEKIKKYINKILSTQDADGYLGIYDKELRYRFDNENGELWAKTTLLRGMMAWYDYTRDPEVLSAIKRAVANVFFNYPINASHPFYSVNPNAGGLTHGLMFTDILEGLYRITGKKEYLDYCLFLYKDFSIQKLNEDAQYEKLIDPAIRLKGHGVHTYEHLRAVAAACYASGNPHLKNALNMFLAKVAHTITPSGGPAGDEFIGGRFADATNTGYEYCSIHELMESYISLLLKTGDPVFAEKTELLFFNAAQGARHPDGMAICYLKTDNSFELSGGKNGDTTEKNQTRYRYSPVHKEAAVCCVPNAGRIGPAYIQNMWVREGDVLVASLLGPSELSLPINSSHVHIQELTEYPFQSTISFRITCSQPVNFELRIRKPEWAQKINASLPYRLENGFITFRNHWDKSSELFISFEKQGVKKINFNGSSFFRSGALVLAHSIEAEQRITKVFPVGAFKEFNYLPEQLALYNYTGNPVFTEQNKPLRFHTKMKNAQSGLQEDIELVPMSETILRQVTFRNDTIR